MEISKEAAIERLSQMLHQVSDGPESGFCTDEERAFADEDAAALTLAIVAIKNLFMQEKLMGFTPLKLLGAPAPQFNGLNYWWNRCKIAEADIKWLSDNAIDIRYAEDKDAQGNDVGEKLKEILNRYGIKY